MVYLVVLFKKMGRMTKEEVKELEEVVVMWQKSPVEAYKKLLEIVVRKKLEVETQSHLKRMERALNRIKKWR
jgi:hypothetical protein